MRTDVPFVPWAEFLERWFVWRQGEHVSLIGPTGGGKTTLALEILPRREWAVAIGTKPKDDTLEALVRQPGWVRQREFKPTARTKKIVLWPKATALRSQKHQAEVLSQAFDDIFAMHNWCIFADEVRYLCKSLGMQPLCESMWLQGRSIGISFVTATQRPAHVPLEMYSQATHVFLWQDSDRYNLRRLGEIGGVNTAAVVHTVPTLERHEVLYVDTRTRLLVRTRVDLPGQRKGAA